MHESGIGDGKVPEIGGKKKSDSGGKVMRIKLFPHPRKNMDESTSIQKGSGKIALINRSL